MFIRVLHPVLALGQLHLWQGCTENSSTTQIHILHCLDGTQPAARMYKASIIPASRQPGQLPVQRLQHHNQGQHGAAAAEVRACWHKLSMPQQIDSVCLDALELHCIHCQCHIAKSCRYRGYTVDICSLHAASHFKYCSLGAGHNRHYSSGYALQ